MKKLLTILFLLITHPALATYLARTDCGTFPNPHEGDVCSQTSTVSGRTSGHLYIYRSAAWVDVDTAGTGAPTNSTYITQTPDATLSNEQAMSALATGIVKNTTATGVQSIAVPGTDYVAPTGSGAGLTSLNASQLSSGTAPTARLGSGSATNSTFLRGDSTWAVPTVSALSANGANCAAGQAAGGVDASGAAEDCFDVATQVEFDAHTGLTSAHGAVSTNTGGRIVLRDGSGNFSAGNITANLTGTVTGNASTSTLAATASALAAPGWIPPVITVATLPASPSNGQEVTVTDGTSAGACESGGGAFRTRCQWNSTSSHWEPAIPSAAASSLQTAKDVGANIANSVDTASCVKIGNGTIFHCIYSDSSNVLHMDATDASGTLIAVDKITKTDANKTVQIQDSSGTAVFTVTDTSGVGAITTAKGLAGGFSIPYTGTGASGAIQDADDFPKIARVPFGQTITKICGTTDTGTTTFNLQRNDGSPVNIASSNIVAATSEVCTTTFTAGENILSEGQYIDLVIVTGATSGTPTKLTIGVNTTRN